MRWIAKLTVLILLDFSNAFNSVDFDVLLDNIKPIPLATDVNELIAKGRFCVYNGKIDDPREVLQCFNANIANLEDSTLVADELGSLRFRFDIGSPLVSDGVQVGVLTSITERWSEFTRTAIYRPWIQSVTGVRMME